MTLSRRAFTLGTAAIAGLAAGPALAQNRLSAEDREAVARAQAYLQGLSSAQGTFVETAGAEPCQHSSISRFTCWKRLPRYIWAKSVCAARCTKLGQIYVAKAQQMNDHRFGLEKSCGGSGLGGQGKGYHGGSGAHRDER